MGVVVSVEALFDVVDENGQSQPIVSYSDPVGPECVRLGVIDNKLPMRLRLKVQASLG